MRKRLYPGTRPGSEQSPTHPARIVILSGDHPSKPSQPDSTAFGIARRELDARTSVISVEGELDLSTAPRLKWMLIDSLQAGQSQLVIDLSQTTFMDSTALGVLVAVNRSLHDDAALAIACPRAAVLRIFELSGMDGVFAIFATLEEALAHARAGTAGAGQSAQA
jgi:anti-sigma B factor antagonist